MWEAINKEPIGMEGRKGVLSKVVASHALGAIPGCSLQVNLSAIELHLELTTQS